MRGFNIGRFVHNKLNFQRVSGVECRISGAGFRVSGENAICQKSIFVLIIIEHLAPRHSASESQCLNRLHR
jgi:hypothetical protein